MVQFLMPDMIVQHGGTKLEEIDAYVVSPCQPTHFPKNAAHRTLDFVVCSASAEPWIKEIAVDEGVEAHPHRAMRVKISAATKHFSSRGSNGQNRLPNTPPWVAPGSLPSQIGAAPLRLLTDLAALQEATLCAPPQSTQCSSCGPPYAMRWKRSSVACMDALAKAARQARLSLVAPLGSGPFGGWRSQ